MDLLKAYYDKKTKDYELCVRRNEVNGEVVLTYRHRSYVALETFVKAFKSDVDYQRFLDEAIALRCLADIKSVKKARNFWRRLVDFMEDKLQNKGVFKTFLLIAFLLMSSACSSDLVVEQAKSEILTVKGEKFVCEYTKGSRIRCDKYSERSLENGL